MPIEGVKNATAKRPVPPAEFQSPDSEPDNTKDLPVNTPESEPTEKSVPPVTAQDDFVFVQMPDGQYRAVRKTDVQKIGAFDNADGTPEVPVQDVYVHLADGSVERVKENKLPGPAGTNSAFGYFERDGKMYDIIGVFPVEHEKG